MDVILLTKVANLGNIGDRVKVKSGYGRNFLLPKGKATLATPDTVKAGTEGKLFGSIGTADIAEAATKAGHKLARAEVRLPTGPLRTVGEHLVALHLHTDIDVQLPVTITAEE